MSMELWWYE